MAPPTLSSSGVSADCDLAASRHIEEALGEAALDSRRFIGHTVIG
jgi:hypothetical protein